MILLRRLARLLVFVGCGCLFVMVLTHVAETWQVLPGMGWGRPNSAGHYLDLVSAVAGVVLLVAACVLRLVIAMAGRRR